MSFRQNGRNSWFFFSLSGIELLASCCAVWSGFWPEAGEALLLLLSRRDGHRTAGELEERRRFSIPAQTSAKTANSSSGAREKKHVKYNFNLNLNFYLVFVFAPMKGPKAWSDWSLDFCLPVGCVDLFARLRSLPGRRWFILFCWVHLLQTVQYPEREI